MVRKLSILFNMLTENQPRSFEGFFFFFDGRVKSGVLLKVVTAAVTIFATSEFFSVVLNV